MTNQSKKASSAAIYGLGFIGAAIYYISTAATSGSDLGF